MTFSLHRGGGVVMSSQTNTHTNTGIKIHPLPHSLDTWALIFSGDNHQRMGGWPERTVPSKKGRVKLIQLPLYQCSPLFTILRIEAQPPPAFLCCPRPPARHPFGLTSVSLVSTLHLLLPLTPFWPYYTHPFFPHVQTISILWTAILANSLFIPAFIHAPSLLTISNRDRTTKLIKHFI